MEAIKDCLDDNKAEDLVTIDLTGKSSLADHMIIASGRSSRHVGAIADHVIKRLKELGAKDVQVEGLPSCDWVLVDAGDVIAAAGDTGGRSRPELYFEIRRAGKPIDPQPWFRQRRPG